VRVAGAETVVVITLILSGCRTDPVDGWLEYIPRATGGLGCASGRREAMLGLSAGLARRVLRWTPSLVRHWPAARRAEPG
jgi:hypothetical protein